MKQAAPPEKLAQAVGPVLKALGEIRRIGEPQTGTLAGMDAALVPVECERGSIQVQVTFDASRRHCRAVPASPGLRPDPCMAAAFLQPA